ncbi:UNVERIFIED_CONTAM: hypothetical protein GTU68_019231 [Idotea baltica]|nr:hypothetical protein [Idotea baltica]
MLVIGIAGGTGSGKTTVVKRIVELLPKGKVVVIPQDNYYKDNAHLPLEERQKLNFDHPSSIETSLLKEHILKLRAEEEIEMPQYSYLDCTRLDETIKVSPAQVVIVEGILLLVEKQIRDLMDIKIFVDCDADVRLMRVIHRDIEERGRDIEAVLNRYTETVKPMHLQFIEPTKRFADIIVPLGAQNKVAIDIITSRIMMKIMNNN